VQPRRLEERFATDVAELHAVLAEAMIAHVGFATPDGPVVIPMVHAVVGDDLVLHGAPSSRALADGQDVCACVTLVDALLLGRSALHHSMRYRCAVVRGRARRLAGDDARVALDAFVEHVVPGRTADVRAPSPAELRRTAVIAVPLAEASLKVRAGFAVDEPEDLDRRCWAGAVPLALLPAGPAEPDPELDPAIVVPAAALADRRPRHRVEPPCT
jgi:nitroimidazol reductase NimA-like FMN-containing flavoprotein (pyridoxamine 5'-phosphate oxidase superfamily)